MHLPSKYQYIIFTFKEITMNNQLLSFEWLLEMKYMIISGGLVFESCGNYLGLDVCVLIEFIWIKIITERERHVGVRCPEMRSINSWLSEVSRTTSYQCRGGQENHHLPENIFQLSIINQKQEIMKRGHLL